MRERAIGVGSRIGGPSVPTRNLQGCFGAGTKLKIWGGDCTSTSLETLNIYEFSRIEFEHSFAV